MNPIASSALIFQRVKTQHTNLICNPKFLLVSLQQVPIVKDHVVLEEEKSISTTVSCKDLGEIPDE